METLNMNGPYRLDSETIDEKVTKTSAGNYAFGKKDEEGNFLVGYVGRADKNLNSRLKSWIGKTKRPLFKYSYATSPKDAFIKECNNFHDFDPPGNSIHPDRPDNSNWKCPQCDVFDD
ncbi:MAG: hypothetical protein K9J16_14475 [Melioribacteraceae bacterium]|nr:hypothetical protein [Melioribacteraceae bacterium]MCF8356215.1 hypothetical protein [Melioribacteraceae bacterium]MCF8396476.1 hypothetical protein [Melioribacteraceae bacterium]MCF8420629.1 hypothetical protein [Melioribacteraceae bacterium]